MTEPIALVTMQLRVPGAASPEQWWHNMTNGLDPIVDLDRDGLIAAGVPDSLLDEPDLIRSTGTVDVPGSGEPWGIGPDQWQATDPQQRLLLTLAHDAMAGRPERAAAGVFVAAGPDRTQLERARTSRDESWDALLPGGSGPDHIAARIAYHLDLGGPAIGVSAACAGSATAVATACLQLQSGRCDLALVGAAHLTSPRYRHTPTGQLSKDGRCRALSAAADGSVMTSGAAVIVLQRLADARADGTPVLAVIEGLGISNDGADRAGYAVPSPVGQIEAIIGAIEAADVHPDDVGLVHCHANGTPLGDAIEATALKSAWDELGADPAGGCVLAAAKTHIGNTDLASGILALCSAVLALRHRRIPGNLHHQHDSPLIDLGGSPFRIASRTQDWPAARDGQRHAAVNSFGVGGTNVHLLVGAADAREAT